MLSSTILGSLDRPRVAVAILHQEGRFLMQLRDNNPAILYPGCWGLFGGHLEPGEDADSAIRRELQEEIAYTLSEVTFLGFYNDDRVIRSVYYGPLTVPVTDLTLNEGWDLDLLSLTEIQQGERYSRVAQQIRPLGKPHRAMILEIARSCYV